MSRAKKSALEPGAKGLEPGAKGLEPGAKGLEPGAKGSAPLAGTKSPVPDPEVIAAFHQIVMTHSLSHRQLMAPLITKVQAALGDLSGDFFVERKNRAAAPSLVRIVLEVEDDPTKYEVTYDQAAARVGHTVQSLRNRLSRGHGTATFKVFDEAAPQVGYGAPEEAATAPSHRVTVTRPETAPVLTRGATHFNRSNFF